MNIGKKIKEIRTDKDLSQENVYPTNQSLVSQIEKGINKNPTEQTLRIMAGNMQLSFEELIEGTEWEMPRSVTRKSEYAFSQTECIVIMDNPGTIKIQMKYYPAVEDTGEVNKFDPDTGYKLLTECKSCKRSIQKNNQKYCFGCGEQLFSDYSFNERIFSESNILYDAAFDNEYSHNINKNKEVINNSSILLAELMDIEKIINPRVQELYSKTLDMKVEKLLEMDVIGNKYFNYFKKYYFTMTNWQMYTSPSWFPGSDVDIEKVKLRTSPEAKELNYFHPGKTGAIPFGVISGDPDFETIDDEKKIYKGGFNLYDMIDINPQKFKSSIIENWWVIFKCDLSITKGLLSELQRHQNKLILQLDEFLKNNPEKEI